MRLSDKDTKACQTPYKDKRTNKDYKQLIPPLNYTSLIISVIFSLICVFTQVDLHSWYWGILLTASIIKFIYVRHTHPDKIEDLTMNAYLVYGIYIGACLLGIFINSYSFGLFPDKSIVGPYGGVIMWRTVMIGLGLFTSIYELYILFNKDVSILGFL